MVRELRTSDVYEASYYMANGIELAAMEAREDLPEGGQCVFILSGEEDILDQLCAAYMTGRAVVNLNQWRRSYVNACQKLRLAKKKLGGGAS